MTEETPSVMYLVASIPIKEDADAQDFFESCMRYASDKMQQVHGCRMWVPALDMTPPENGHKLAKSQDSRSNVVTVLERWDTVADFENYLASGAKKEFEVLVGEFIAEGQKVDIRYLHQ